MMHSYSHTAVAEIDIHARAHTHIHKDGSEASISNMAAGFVVYARTHSQGWQHSFIGDTAAGLVVLAVLLVASAFGLESLAMYAPRLSLFFDRSCCWS